MKSIPEIIKEWEKFSETVEADFISSGYTANEQVADFIKAKIVERDEEWKQKIMEWAERHIQDEISVFGTDKHGIAKEDLIKFINK